MRIIKALLIGLVLASLTAVVFQEIGKKQSTTSPSSPVTTANQVMQSKVIAYYFHGNVRCATCRKLEQYSKEAIEKGFPTAISEGRLEWQIANVDEAANEHYIKDFALTTRSVVLVKYENGQQKRWKNLNLIWELVSDQKAFQSYIQKETEAFLTLSP